MSAKNTYSDVIAAEDELLRERRRKIMGDDFAAVYFENPAYLGTIETEAAKIAGEFGIE